MIESELVHCNRCGQNLLSQNASGSEWPGPDQHQCKPSPVYSVILDMIYYEEGMKKTRKVYAEISSGALHNIRDLPCGAQIKKW